MRNSERDVLLQIQSILMRVPFPHDGLGAKTASVKGHVDYVQDMIALLPMIQKLLMDLVTIDNLRKHPDIRDDYVEGWDYHKPELTLRAIEEWLDLRRKQNWDNPDRHELKCIFDRICNEMTEGNIHEVAGENKTNL